MSRFSDIDPMDLDPDTGRPYSNYSSPALDTSFHDAEMAGEEPAVPSFRHVRTYTDERLAELVRSHGRGGDGEIDVAFLAAVSTELASRGKHLIPIKAPLSKMERHYANLTDRAEREAERRALGGES